MTRDELRILAGITSGVDAEGARSFTKKTLTETSGPLVPSFTIQNDDNAGKTAVALAKAGISVDMEYAMDTFYFNFKTEGIAEHAEKIMSRVIDKSKELQTEGVKGLDDHSFKRGDILTVKKTGVKVEMIGVNGDGTIATHRIDTPKTDIPKASNFVPTPKGHANYMPRELEKEPEDTD